MVLLADCGSSWSKIWDTESDVIDLLDTRSLVSYDDVVFDLATGHLARSRTRRYENELLALARGSLNLVDEAGYTVVDVGSRDTKYCRFKDRKLTRLDWNQACGSSTGFTLELLGNYYDIAYDTLPPSPERISVTCGVFGIERIFDSIIKGGSPHEAVARFVHGVAYNVYSFAGTPKKMYLSGGLCLNRCFVESLRNYCQVVPLGRHVLLEGLRVLSN